MWCKGSPCNVCVEWRSPHSRGKLGGDEIRCWCLAEFDCGLGIGICGGELGFLGNGICGRWNWVCCYPFAEGEFRVGVRLFI